MKILLEAQRRLAAAELQALKPLPIQAEAAQ